MAKKAKLLELPVSFGNVNIGEDTVRLGLEVMRKDLTPAAADKHFCGKRIVGRVISAAGNSNGDQPTIFEAGETIEAAFDVKSFNVKRKAISFGLTFNLASVDINELAHFASRSGRLQVDAVEELKEKEKPAKDDGEEDEEEE